MNNEISSGKVSESKRRITEITIETHSLTIIRARGRQFSAYCERCRKIVSAFAPEQMAAFLRLDLTEVCRRVQTDELHLTETRRGVATICADSFQSNGDSIKP